MNIEYKFTVEPIDKENNRYKIKDVTGNYSVDNPNGFGEGMFYPENNYPRTNINSAILTITLPDSTTDIFDITSSVNINKSEDFELYLTSEKDLIDGKYIYSIVLSIDNDEDPVVAEEITSEVVVYEYSTTELKINEYITDNINFCSEPDQSCKVNYITLWSYYLSLKASSEKSNFIKFEYLLNKINSLLS